ncbi:hypothetical protein I5535_00370 [Rhodobacteraceae bacterium F11138]|nr:hypothetical protein [Rhodobacteraceae bacterium F11138]
MKREKLGQMATVTEALYLDEFRKIQNILAEESRLRKELARLDEQSQAERNTTPDDLSMQSIGADLLWKAWLTRTRRQLNIELAQVMAKKLTAMGGVRKAFGRKNAVASMHETALKDAKSQARLRAMQALLNEANLR